VGTVNALALGHPTHELVDVETLRIGGGGDPWGQLIGQLLGQIPRLAGGDALGERLQRRTDGALGALAPYAQILLDERDEVLIVHAVVHAVLCRPRSGSR
jgi:hypothetical protein